METKGITEGECVDHFVSQLQDAGWTLISPCQEINPCKPVAFAVIGNDDFEVSIDYFFGLAWKVYSEFYVALQPNGLGADAAFYTMWTPLPRIRVRISLTSDKADSKVLILYRAINN